MEITSNKKLIIFTRHGERTDHVGLVPKLGPCDPELTEEGCQQAYLMGQILSEEISNFIKDQKCKIIILSSPFARTLQTSRDIFSGLLDNENNCLEIEKEIHVDHLLSEFIKEDLIENLPVNYLSLYNNSEFLPSELSEWNINFLNLKQELPVVEESHNTCLLRMQKCLENLKNEVLKKQDIQIVIMVSHLTPIEKINKILGYPNHQEKKYTNYCDSYFYLHDIDSNKTEYLCKKTLIN
jgi:broad specificity phosphatase PhoE